MFSGKDIRVIRSEHGAYTPERKLQLIDKNRELLYRKVDNPFKKEPPEDFVQNILEFFPDNDELNLSLFYENYEYSTIMLKAWNNLFHKGIDCRYRQKGALFSWQNCIEITVKQGTLTAIQIMGQQGIGKTVLSQEIALELAEACKMTPIFYMDADDPKMCYPARNEAVYQMATRITYGYDETIEKIRTQPENSILLQDESDALSGVNSQKTMKALRSALSVFMRALHIRIIFNDSQPIPIPQLRYYVEVISRNKAKNKTLARIGVPSGQKEPNWRGIVVFDTNRIPGLYDAYIPLVMDVKRRRQEAAGQHMRKGGDLLGPAGEIAMNFFAFKMDPENATFIEWLHEEDKKALERFQQYVARYEQKWSGDMDAESIIQFAWFFIRRGYVKKPLEEPEQPPEIIEEEASITDEDIIAAELAKPSDDALRKGFLQLGYNVTRNDIETYRAELIDEADLREISNERNERARKAWLQDQLEERIEVAMCMFDPNPDRERLLAVIHDAESTSPMQSLDGEENIPADIEFQRHVEAYKQEGFDVCLDDINAFETGDLTGDELQAISNANKIQKMHDVWNSILRREVSGIYRSATKSKSNGKWTWKCQHVGRNIETAMTSLFTTARDVILQRIKSRLSVPVIETSDEAADIRTERDEKDDIDGNCAKESNVAPGKPFSFSIEKALNAYRCQPGENRNREADIYSALQEKSKLVVAHEFPNMQTGEDLTETGLTKIDKIVDGFISHQIGHAFEPHFASEKEKELGNGWKISHSDASGQGQADTLAINIALNAFIIYTIKVRYSAMSKTKTLDTHDNEEGIQVELDTWNAMMKNPQSNDLRAGVKGRLFVVYHDERIHKDKEKEIENPLDPPAKIRLSRINGEPVIKFIS